MSEEKLKPVLPKELNLKKDFTPPSYEEWHTKVEQDLKGASFEKKLITKTYEEIYLQPIYTRKDLEDLKFINEFPGEGNFVRCKNSSGYLKNGWEICQDIAYSLPHNFNEALKNDLVRGQNSISIILDDASKLGLDADSAAIGRVGKNGVSISSLQDFQNVFDEIDITKYPVHINAGFSILPILSLFAAYLSQNKIDTQKIKGSITADPISYLLQNGKLPIDFDHLYDELKFAIKWTSEKLPNIKIIGVSGLEYHNTGASAVQELAYTFAAAVEYINRLSEKEIDVNQITKQMRFTFGVGSFFFIEIAKLRAAKIIWSKITEAFGVTEENRKMNLHAKTSYFTQTKFDPYVNMLRTTTEAFSAIIGGIDSLHTNPFDEIFGIPDQFSRRIARNTQIILDEETHLTNLIDPAGGSFFVEKLTEEIAGSVWKEFQKVESKGGIINALKEDYPQSEIQKVWEVRKSDISKRKSIIVGTNMYANLKEGIKSKNEPDYEVIHKKRCEHLQSLRSSNKKEKNNLEKLMQLMKESSPKDRSDENNFDIFIKTVSEGATLGEISKAVRVSADEGLSINKIEKKRAAEFFESLRDKSEAIKSKRGSRPKVFPAVMGTLKQFKARADFSQGFFEVGGFEIVYPKGFDSTNEAVKAVNESKADVVVICSTDETYSELVPTLTKGIRKNNKDVIIVLAGYPKDQIEEHKKSGVDEFIYLGCDAFELLSKLLNKIQ